jgi:hypothetical protein
VLEAWKSINAHLQTKSGVSILSDDKLVSSLLGDPRKGNVVKMHMPNDGSASWETRQRGALLLGQAIVAGIRNVLAHELVSVSESEALEYLASMSVFARWIDSGTVVQPESKL